MAIPSAALLDVLGPGGRIAEALPGWEPRPSQLEMAAQVEESLARHRPLLVEAGTGTGKTLAYLVPAILSGLKVVVSTGTKNLQEQILKKDIPLLQAHMPVSFTAAGLKGISNYLCLRRFRDYSAMQQMRGDDTLELHEFREWADETGSGDRAELPDLPDDSPLWREVSATTETRIGPRCPFYEQCFVTRARRTAQGADILVVNHHLFFADLSLKEKWPQAQLLPAYEAVIFDEAHQLEEVATDYFGLSVSSLRVGRLVRDLQLAVTGAHLDARGDRTAAHLEAAGEALFSLLRARLPRDGRVSAGDDLWRGEPLRAALEPDTSLEEVEALAGNAAGDSVEDQERASSIARRARSLRDDLSVVSERSDRGKVFWAETRGRTVLLNASPVDVADAIRDKLLAQVEAAVFTSATLTAGGSFDYVRGRLGLEAALEAKVGSPFDYREQALLYLPRDLPEPSEPGFTNAAAQRILPLVEAAGGRAFLLFTSHRQMQAVYRLLAPRITLPVLLQGERPKHLMLEAFRARPSVLFATGAFWEGVDVVGEALELVVIDKLPFAPPDDPLVAARVARLAEEGRDGFADYQVPQAALSLAQGFGRLIRHRQDRGVVAILDRRAVTRGYGRQILSSLPADCPRTSDLDEVCAFLRSLRAV